MPNLIKKLQTLAADPRAGKLIAQARQQATKPEHRQRLNQLRARITRRP